MKGWNFYQMGTIKYLTPEEFRKLQLAQLPLIEELDRVCRKHDIKYTMALEEMEANDSLSRLKTDQSVVLSRGEAEILPMIAEGMTSKDIAKRLFLTEQTIKWRRQRLIAKFDARNTAEMLSKARESGLL